MEDGSERIDINRAPQEALSQLPGIGPALAGRIVAYRSAVQLFGSIDDLTNVPGISQRMVSAMAEQIEARPAEPEVPEPIVRWETLGEVTADDVAPTVEGVRVTKQEPDEERGRNGSLPPLPASVAAPDEENAEAAGPAEQAPDAEAQPAAVPGAIAEPAPDEADVSEAETADAVDVRVLSPDVGDDEEPDAAEEEARSIWPEPEPEEATVPERAPEIVPATAPAWRRGCAVVVTGLLGAVVGAVATLLILAGLNDGELRFAPVSNVDALEDLRGAQTETMGDVDGLELELVRQREALEAELTAVSADVATINAAGAENEAVLGTIAADAARLEATASALEEDIAQVDAVADDFGVLVNGLRTLLDDLESVATPSPTPTPTVTPTAPESTVPSPTATTRATRTPRPSATPFLTVTPDS